MNKKAARAVRAEIEKRGGEIVSIEDGSKHRIVTVNLGGRLVDINFSRGCNDEVVIRHIVRNRLK